jgi:hypothetical protein
MELKDFINETLTQIMQGIRDAQSDESKHGGEINPRIIIGDYLLDRKEEIRRAGMMLSDMHEAIDFVNFDVAVTVTEATGTKGGIGILMGVVGAGSQGQSSASSGSLNRIQFRIPVSYPKHNKGAALAISAAPLAVKDN